MVAEPHEQRKKKKKRQHRQLSKTNPLSQPHSRATWKASCSGVGEWVSKWVQLNQKCSEAKGKGWKSCSRRGRGGEVEAMSEVEKRKSRRIFPPQSVPPRFLIFSF